MMFVCRKKRKAEDEPPALKKSKSEKKEEKVLREQSQLIWKYHDTLKENLSKYSLQALLRENGQQIPSGEKVVRVAVCRRERGLAKQSTGRIKGGMNFVAIKSCCGIAPTLFD